MLTRPTCLSLNLCDCSEAVIKPGLVSIMYSVGESWIEILDMGAWPKGGDVFQGMVEGLRYQVVWVIGVDYTLYICNYIICFYCL
jgi:hypothetical protein